MPATRRSDWRSSRSNPSPSISWKAGAGRRPGARRRRRSTREWSQQSSTGERSWQASSSPTASHAPRPRPRTSTARRIERCTTRSRSTGVLGVAVWTEDPSGPRGSSPTAACPALGRQSAVRRCPTPAPAGTPPAGHLVRRAAHGRRHRPALLGVPADALRDRAVPLDSRWADARVRRLSEQVADGSAAASHRPVRAQRVRAAPTRSAGTSSPSPHRHPGRRHGRPARAQSAPAAPQVPARVRVRPAAPVPGSSAGAGLSRRRGRWPRWRTRAATRTRPTSAVRFGTSPGRHRASFAGR
jgi:hypothetical protein